MEQVGGMGKKYKREGALPQMEAKKNRSKRSKNGIAKKLPSGPCGSCLKMFPLARFESGTRADPWRELLQAH